MLKINATTATATCLAPAPVFRVPEARLQSYPCGNLQAACADVATAMPAAAAAAFHAVISSTIASSISSDISPDISSDIASNSASDSESDSAAMVCEQMPGHAGQRAASAAMAGDTENRTASCQPVPANWPELAKLVSALYVDASAAGPREVRVVLSDSVLPKTSVAVAEESGRVAVRFHCGARAACDRLCGCAPRLADELASRLARGVVLSVGHEDLGGLWLAQVYADAPEA